MSVQRKARHIGDPVGKHPLLPGTAVWIKYARRAARPATVVEDCGAEVLVRHALFPHEVRQPDFKVSRERLIHR